MTEEVMPIFRVLRFVRDARSTKHAERDLLNALALRCNPKKKYIAWPSYALLAKDTLLDEITLKRAAKRLEDAGLIKRVQRQNRSNLFFLNVALLQQQAAAVKEAELMDKEEVEAAPFADPMIPEAAQDEEEDLDWAGGGL